VVSALTALATCTRKPLGKWIRLMFPALAQWIRKSAHCLQCAVISGWRTAGPIFFVPTFRESIATHSDTRKYCLDAALDGLATYVACNPNNAVVFIWDSCCASCGEFVNAHRRWRARPMELGRGMTVILLSEYFTANACALRRRNQIGHC